MKGEKFTGMSPGKGDCGDGGGGREAENAVGRCDFAADFWVGSPGRGWVSAGDWGKSVGGRAKGVDANVWARCAHGRHEPPRMAKVQVAHRRRQRRCVPPGGPWLSKANRRCGRTHSQFVDSSNPRCSALSTELLSHVTWCLLHI